MSLPKTAEIYQAPVDPPIELEGETNSNPKANFQKIPACQRLGAQQLLSEIRFTEIKADMMDDLTIKLLQYQRTSEAPNPSGLATRIRDGKPGTT